MVQKTWWIWLICGTLLGVLLTILFGKGCVIQKPTTRLIYKSDTVRLTVEKWQHDTIEKPYQEVLPEKVLIYEDTTDWAIKPWKDTTNPYLTIDSNKLFVNWGKNNFGYNLKYLGRFLDAPKLLEGKFTNDSISLTLFDTSGNIVKRIWPISYNIFNYHWRDNRLLAVDRETPKSEPLKLPEGITTSANLYGFYSLIHGGFTLASDFWVTKKRFSIGAIGELRTYKTYGDIKVGVKYSIK
jgi:hypothetical protein